MRRFGPNLFGEALEPGRITRVRLGMVVDQPTVQAPGAPGSILLVAAPGLTHPRVRALDGGVLYDLLTGHPSRRPGDLVFLADLTQELWAWDGSTWEALGIDPASVAALLAELHRHGAIDALRLDDLGAAELRALGRLPMTRDRDQLRQRLNQRSSTHAAPWPPPATTHGW